jgi:hypothetical protein
MSPRRRSIPVLGRRKRSILEMTPIEEVEAAIKSLDGVTWTSSGYPLLREHGEPPTDAGWVKFGLEESELGWRTLEFLAWLATDMLRAGERLHFFPTSPPPYLNTPRSCLSFVLEGGGVHQLLP